MKKFRRHHNHQILKFFFYYLWYQLSFQTLIKSLYSQKRYLDYCILVVIISLLSCWKLRRNSNLLLLDDQALYQCLSPLFSCRLIIGPLLNASVGDKYSNFWGAMSDKVSLIFVIELFLLSWNKFFIWFVYYYAHFLKYKSRETCNDRLKIH